MTLRLGPIADDKPVKVTIDLPSDVYRDLAVYSEAHTAATGQPSSGPARLIVPMLIHFMANDRGFATVKRKRLRDG
ncbi:DUF2274 domain-containing protein [Sphingomonas sp. PB4P5]|jgi:hypothetical protein|uniref:DUF2274 domain-containing protein n=1 Tax=Parasphingomonas puruogangriensis TaxID=3096155 RepID=UPI002FCABE6F